MIHGLSGFGRGLVCALGEAQPKEEVTLTTGGRGLELVRTGGAWQITLKQERLLARALMLLRENADANDGFSLYESPSYERLGVLLDCSRNAVPRPDTCKTLLCALARMGYGVVQLYMEDTFLLPGYPYFGYARGGYTKEELKELDGFAASLGIELVPAVQTLAHLGQSLKWKAMNELVDVGDILLIDDEKTYALIDAMFAALAESFSCRRVNIGMDEAHMVGLGRYLDKHGYTDRVQLMLRHFTRVREIADKHGFSVMLWSDMFFRLASGGDYYAPECKIDALVAESIPEDTTLIYWDYYSEDQGIYQKMLEKHAQLSPNTIFAGGAWKWTGFSPNNAFSIKLADLAHPACRANGVSEVMLTMWGDNGAECSPFAVLPTLQYWAELCFAGKISQAALQTRFALCTGGAWDGFCALDKPAFTPGNPAPGRCAVNPPKYLLYEDVLFGLFSAELDPAAYARHFDICAQSLQRYREAAQDRWRYLFHTQALLCGALAEKCRTQGALRAAWKAKDRPALRELCDTRLPELTARLREFVGAFHKQWLHENRAAGLDVFDLRIGGLLQRVDTAAQRVRAYLNGEIETVEELDMRPLPFDPAAAKEGFADIQTPFWHDIASPSHIALI